MKKLALPILAFALLGIASLFIPGPHGSLFQLYAEFDTVRLTLLVISFAMAALAAGLALRGVRAWHGYVAFGGFALAFVKARVWTALQEIDGLRPMPKLHAIAIVGGVIFTLIATMIGEPRDTAEATG